MDEEKHDDFIDEESDFEDIHGEQNTTTQDQVDNYDQKIFNRSNAIREELFDFGSFGRSMICPFKNLCDFAYEIDVFDYSPIRTLRYEIPNAFKSQKQNFIHLLGQIITPTITIYVKDSLNLTKKNTQLRLDFLMLKI
ncbi:hypothetical protein BN7_1648 [Wickerhamomyces ciferrii]|uniref:Uncharacterized protein n=1 Tax=Wickerhamomyces ciferrii (strain ATCC 14091 / BCRC 22168 / CBS 111 / JCM 3599 / NBRC 0793 / NRRL Y-1031 F-60-10) TaxID=1206466 RepID=K0KGJ9_WICCF|nr:uncharacterized protein BN7_1648 [Wickerhamomyces ciferrii]CCH42106.1 hypothetical protein BN7_1648 [Wickerhamomyces ciferrii]